MSISIITEPSVYLVGKPAIAGGAASFLDDIGNRCDFKLLDTSAAEKLPEIGGRLCYMSFAKPRPGGNAAYLRHILEVGHGSVLEHANFTFIFAGVSRSLTHELVRHRAGMAYSQLSQRYVDEGDVAFVVPPALAREVAAYQAWAEDRRAHALENYRPMTSEEAAGYRWTRSVEQCQVNYSDMSDYLFARTSDVADRTARRKAAREAARSVLPNCTETKIQVTGNCRAWRNFLEQRGSVFADAEIRRLAIAICSVLKGESPAIFDDFESWTSPEGVEYLRNKHRKV